MESELIEDFYVAHGGSPHLQEDLSFYESDWNMLMRVVQKMRPLWMYSQTDLASKLMQGCFDSDIKVVHECVVEFIEWYNFNNNLLK